jgi:hypothetical protein
VFRLFILKVTGPSPHGPKTACAKGQPTPPPPPHVVPHPESLAGQAAYPFGHSAIAQISLGPNFPGIGVLPRPATGSHIVIRGTPVAPLGH